MYSIAETKALLSSILISSPLLSSINSSGPPHLVDITGIPHIKASAVTNENVFVLTVYNVKI